VSTLKELISESALITEAIIDASGELTPELEAKLLSLEIHLPEKIDRYSGLIERLSHEYEYFDAQARKMAKIAQSLDKLQTKLKENIKQQMIEHGLLELRGNNEKFTLSRGKPTVKITDLTQIPRKFIKQVVTESALKDELKAAMESGELFNGATLEQNLVLRKSIIKGT
jgi:hypothetical protein